MRGNRPKPWLVVTATMTAALWITCATSVEAQSPVEFDLQAPKLSGEVKDWLNTNGKALSFEKGRVYVVEFWTFG